ncbi:MAG TPA: phosphotransferase [Thermoanaerobaculia bacterium]|nr:phosphotransferase [Thermoanaerobaculia bacterium]
MLSEADAVLVRRDPAIPGLALVLDPDAFIAAVTPHLGGRQVRGISSGYARYKPHTSCLVAWKLDLGATSLFVHAKAYGRSQVGKFGGAAEQSDDAHFAVPDLATTISIFPRDRVLSGLLRIDEASVRAQLFPGATDLRTAQLQTLSYKAERRYVGRCGAGDDRSAVVRIYSAEHYEAGRRAFNRITSGDTYRVPALLGVSNRARALAVEWLPGRLLTHLLPESLESVQLTAIALAELHGRSGRKFPASDPSVEAAELLQLGADMRALAPHLSSRVERAAQHLATRVAALARRRALIHGDFYADQVIIGTTVQLIDLDAAHAGDPCSDIANFLAHLEAAALESTLPASSIAVITDAFLAAYESAKPWHTTEERLTVRKACSLFRLLPRPFRTRRRHWAQETAEILDRVERLIDGKSLKPSPTRNRVVVRDDKNAAADPAMPMIAAALDPTVIGEHFSSILGSRKRWQLQEIRVTRYKTGNRCVIEYGLEVDGKPARFLGRIRANAFHRRAWRVNNELWRNGFGAAAGVFVPQPVAAIKRLHLWLQRKVTGTEATVALPAREWRDAAARSAAAAAAMHRSAIALPHRHTVDDELAILSERFGRLAAMKPEISGRLERILSACVSVARTLDGAEHTVIHRDYYPDHLLFENDHTWLLDLDLATIGDPALDVGNFIAHLTEHALRHFGDPDVLIDREEAIADAYCRAIPSVTRDRIDAWAALSLARHVQLCTIVSGRAHLLPRMLDVAESRLSVAR